MTIWTLIRRSLRFQARAHAGVLLGSAIGSAALMGALVVGDSVRASLRDRALQRLDHAWFALAPQEHLFSQNLAQQFNGLYRGRTFIQGLPLGPTVDPQSQAVSAPLLALPATAVSPGALGRANHVQVLGVDNTFWKFTGAWHFTNMAKGNVVLNQALASQLHAHEGDRVILRVSNGGQLSLDSAIAPRTKQSSAFPCTVTGIFPPGLGGDLDLQSGAAPPLNAFVRVEDLADRTGLTNKANLILLGPVLHAHPGQQARAGGLFTLARNLWSRLMYGHWFRPAHDLTSTEEALSALGEQLQANWRLEDAGLKLNYAPDTQGIELRSAEVFLPAPVIAASGQVETNGIPILTYLANLLVAGSNATPYSMVTAAGPPFTPSDLSEDEIVLSQWLADDLHALPGDKVSLSYFAPESGAQLAERTNTFRVRSIVPPEMPWADKTLMPDFPGIEQAENARDWDAGFPLVYKIRPKDEQYWKEHRGTPKAFLSLAAGQKMWANRFGQLTALRFPDPRGMPTAEHWGTFKPRLLATLKPDEVGLQFEPVRDRALKAAEQSQDFGQLFLGFSLFLVVAALLLMALLFQLALEQRVTEVGTLLACGFTARQVRRLLLTEAGVLAIIGGALGAFGGLAYAKAMLWGLQTIWRSAIGPSSLHFSASGSSLITGFCASAIIAWLTSWLVIRKQARQPIRELLAGQVQTPISKVRRRWAPWVSGASAVAAAAIIIYAVAEHQTANAPVFFGAGTLLLVAGLAFIATWFAVLAQHSSPGQLTLTTLGVRGCVRRKTRSLATAALLACGCFVIVAIGVFRLDANRDAGRRSSGTGGFALIGESTLPIVQDLNTSSGRESFGLNAQDLAGANIVPLRVRAGDEASCLNLNRAQKPRLLGVRPELLAGRFTFSGAAKGLDPRTGWRLLAPSPVAQPSTLDPQLSSDEVPAVGDANSIEWALGKKLGETLDYTDEQGRPFKVRLVGALANSILQGSLLISETDFVKKFPGESGYRMLLIDTPSNHVIAVSQSLSRALQDLGLEFTPTVRRLNQFNAVQNTYLGTFQVLGGLGLLLGSAGLGVVVLRNLWERRAELGLLVALGFRKPLLFRFVLIEHGALLGLGLGLGILAAAVAVIPALLQRGNQLPYASLCLMLGAVLLNGALWTWAATRYALRGNLLAALRNE